MALAKQSETKNKKKGAKNGLANGEEIKNKTTKNQNNLTKSLQTKPLTPPKTIKHLAS
jgi:hypothetical protein